MRRLREHEPPVPGPRRPGVRAADGVAAWARLGEVLDAAAAEPSVAHRIGAIEHRVHLRSAEDPDVGLVLDARGGRLEVVDPGAGSTDATIELTLALADVELLTLGRLRPAMAIATGRATYRGPVRELLRVLPLVQAMVAPPIAVGTEEGGA